MNQKYRVQYEDYSWSDWMTADEFFKLPKEYRAIEESKEMTKKDFEKHYNCLTSPK